MYSSNQQRKIKVMTLFLPTPTLKLIQDMFNCKLIKWIKCPNVSRDELAKQYTMLIWYVLRKYSLNLTYLDFYDTKKFNIFQEWVHNDTVTCISRNAPYKDINTVKIENQQYICIPKANYKLNVHNCKLQIALPTE